VNKDPIPSSHADKYANDALINNNDFQFDIPDAKTNQQTQNNNQNQFFDFDFGSAGQANAAASNAYQQNSNQGGGFSGNSGAKQ